jgi:nucleoside-diphosphate-sugar epimerase
MNEKTLLLGGNGYIGQAIAEREPGLSRFSHRRPQGPRDHGWLAREAERLSDALHGKSSVICAAGGPPTAQIATAQILREVLPASAVRHLVYLSSIAVYAANQGGIDESSPTKRFTFSPYVRSKLLAETSCHYLDEYGVSVSILRLGLVVGNGSPRWEKWVGDLIRAGKLGNLGKHGRHSAPLVHIDDVVDYLFYEIINPPSGIRIRNIVSANPISWNQYFACVAAQKGIERPKETSWITLLQSALGGGLLPNHHRPLVPSLSLLADLHRKTEISSLSALSHPRPLLSPSLIRHESCPIRRNETVI